MILLYIFALNILAYLLFVFDRIQIAYSRKGIPALFLILLMILGGAFGILCGMILSKHKVNNKNYRTWIPICVYIQLVVFVVCLKLSL